MNKSYDIGYQQGYLKGKEQAEFESIRIGCAQCVAKSEKIAQLEARLDVRKEAIMEYQQKIQQLRERLK